MITVYDKEIIYDERFRWKDKPGADGMYQAMYDDKSGIEWVNIMNGHIADHNIPFESINDFCFWAGPFPLIGGD